MIWLAKAKVGPDRADAQMVEWVEEAEAASDAEVVAIATRLMRTEGGQ